MKSQAIQHIGSKKHTTSKPKLAQKSKSVQKPKDLPPPEFSKSLNTYLGPKGYTIYKKELTDYELNSLYKMLCARPVTPGVCFGPQSPEFPIYRESDNKLYMPRFFGETAFGTPKKTNIGNGDPINVAFNGVLRDNQVPVVDAYLNHVEKHPYGGGGLLDLPCAFGKCLGINTPILMYDGSIKAVQDVCVDDQIMGDDSTPRNILSLARGREKMYRINYATGSYVVNESHIMSFKSTSFKTNKFNIDMPLTKYLDIPVEKRSGFKGYRVPIRFQTNTLGVNTRITTLTAILNQEAYIDNSLIVINVANKRIEWINSILFVARSLGIHCWFSVQINEVYFQISREIASTILENTLSSDLENMLPDKFDDDPLMYDIEVEPLDIDDYYGFVIDGNHRFVLGDFSVTHNTSLSLNIISRLGRKALVIVNKEFLLNQWVERIRQFLPTARVGTIQGPIIDIENKDIVIGMLQSISMKDYDSDVFKSFGITIIDEVHHISSEVFSRALFKIVTKYMLGLSATMDRKDGTTHVFKMFLGDVVYKGTRDEEHDVEVRAIEYISGDAEFNKVELDFRGNPKYSTMIVKLCDFNRRSEFIVRVLHDMIKEQPASQIMILAHNRSLLTYLHDAIVHRGFATCGYYVGGMKEESLKETESKQIVIATYAMAAEALDIKTLSSLIMVTPKTDIVQSVGRILRVRHEKPIVVDIVDTHDVFQKQWVQRRRFYRKCNYVIKMINSNDYYGMDIDWTKDKKWKMVFNPKNKRDSCVVKDKDTDDEQEEEQKVKPCMIQIDGLIDVDQ